MRILPLLLVFAAACGDPSKLGGQEGEPLVPEAPPPAADFDDVDAGAQCPPVVHCVGDGWCVEYGAEAAPDLSEDCPDTSGDGPCPDTGDAMASCALPDGDACSTVYVMDAEAAGLCE